MHRLRLLVHAAAAALGGDACAALQLLGRQFNKQCVRSGDWQQSSAALPTLPS